MPHRGDADAGQEEEGVVKKLVIGGHQSANFKFNFKLVEVFRKLRAPRAKPAPAHPAARKSARRRAHPALTSSTTMPGKAGGTAKPLKAPKGAEKNLSEEDIAFQAKQKAEAKACVHTSTRRAAHSTRHAPRQCIMHIDATIRRRARACLLTVGQPRSNTPRTTRAHTPPRRLKDAAAKMKK